MCEQSDGTHAYVQMACIDDMSSLLALPLCTGEMNPELRRVEEF